MAEVFVTGGTGYIGSRVIARLTHRGHGVRALVRPGSGHKLPAGVTPVSGNALDGGSFARSVAGCDTFLQLVGTPHPSPSKAAEFQRVDRVSVLESVQVARAAGLTHFVYVSVAHPAPIMQAYVAVRREGEEAIAAAGLTASVLRPWYVLGPGHRWAYALLPAYALLKRIPSTRDTAQRLDLVTIHDMIGALVHAVELPPTSGTRRVWEPAEIRRAASGHG